MTRPKAREGTARRRIVDILELELRNTARDVPPHPGSATVARESGWLIRLREGNDVAVGVGKGKLGDSVPLMLKRHHDCDFALKGLMHARDVGDLDEKR